ncbi:MAG: malto-oligosyltrehalose trehalohydrolase [Chthoniobacterales bacterium]
MNHTTEVASRSQGAELIANGIVRYRTWSEHQRVDVLVLDHSRTILRTIRMEPEGDGYFEAYDETGRAGDLYRYRLNDAADWPDPASRFQPFGVHGPSMVVDAASFEWTDYERERPAFDRLVIYELHIGTFTPAGTFRAAIEKLPHLAQLGVTAIEIMPLGDFPGERNWGYDGVMPYAPARVYGTPDDLRALVDAAHAHRFAVILDVVYNHFGPDGNYTSLFHGGYLTSKHKTPWGDAFDLECEPVRAFFAENPPYWMREFHIDGFRLDATHEIYDPTEGHLLCEIAERVHELGGFVVAEDDRNDPQLLTPRADGGLGFDGAWADDFHHVVRVMLTGDNEGYFKNFRGTVDELAQTLSHGWLYRGQATLAGNEPRGGSPAALHPRQFIYCISNHDQVGNRAFGERLSTVVLPAAYRAASALLCLVPETPMLFMGQEWAASTPFQYFTDHNEELGRAITKGRRHEFRHFSAFQDPAAREKIPDPQAESTFLNSKLQWAGITTDDHAKVLQLYRELLELRRTHPAFRTRSRENWIVAQLDDMIAIMFGTPGEYSFGLVVDLVGGHPMPNLDDARIAPGGGRDWQPLFSSNETRFGGDGAPLFSVPTTLVLEAV